MYKAAAVLSALMKECTIPCRDRGPIIMLVLQSCTDSLHILPGSSGESHATLSDGACNFSNMEVEKDVDVIEESFIAVNEEADIGIKEEEIPEDINFPDIKSEPDEVSCLCVSVIRHNLPVCSNVSCFSNSTIVNKNFFLSFFGVGGCGRVCTRWVDLRLIAEKIKICSFLHVVKILYPQDDS